MALPSPRYRRVSKCKYSFSTRPVEKWQLLVGKGELAVTFHVLVQTQRHAHVADLDGLEVALDDHVARLHVAVQQLLLVVQILLKGGGKKQFI